MLRVCGNLSLVVLFSLALSAAAQTAPSGPSLEGTWEGKLSTPAGGLRVVFHVTAQPDGSLRAALDSPDQGAVGIPMTRPVVNKNTLRLECPTIGGAFYGSFEKDGSVSGVWSQNGGSFPLVLKHVETASAASRPQEPKPPLPYRVEEVTYPSGQAGVALAATLTVPEGKGPFPAVLLVAGSGPVDRNETVFGHKPFLVLADGLTRRGIVVLRADKRGLGGSTGNLATSTDADYVSDALGGVAYLKSRREVNTKAIGIAGHSEGGLVAPRAAAVSPDVAFIILMAGPGLPGKQIILGQQALLLKASGAGDATIRSKQAAEEQVLTVVIQEKDDAVAEAKLRAIMKSEVPRGTPDSAITGQIRGLLSPWYKDFLVFDPRPTLGKVKCPVLAIAGEKDLQVPPIENLTAIKDALKAGGNQTYTLKLLPGLNHLFQTSRTGLPSEYGTIQETFSPVALQLIGDWILGLHKGT
jgi:pimeloyl-ACP methyl ester carboxylesterase